MRRRRGLKNEDHGQGVSSRRHGEPQAGGRAGRRKGYGWFKDSAKRVEQHYAKWAKAHPLKK